VIFCSCISGGVLQRLLEESLCMLYG
jgi:hypothetical protein